MNSANLSLPKDGIGKYYFVSGPIGLQQKAELWLNIILSIKFSLFFCLNNLIHRLKWYINFILSCRMWPSCVKDKCSDFQSILRGCLHHVTGVHFWTTGDGLGAGQCLHGDLDDEGQDKPLLGQRSKAHEALRSVVMNHTWLKNAGEHYCNFRYQITFWWHIPTTPCTRARNNSFFSSSIPIRQSDLGFSTSTEFQFKNNDLS